MSSTRAIEGSTPQDDPVFDNTPAADSVPAAVEDIDDMELYGDLDPADVDYEPADVDYEPEEQPDEAAAPAAATDLTAGAAATSPFSETAPSNGMSEDISNYPVVGS